jgi:hypothetical protein
MERMTHDDLHIQDQTERGEDLATKAQQRLLTFANLSALEQNRATQQMAADEGWTLWPLGRFRLRDGSVLWRSSAGWQSLSAAAADARLDAERKQPLEVRLFHAFSGGNGREKHSISEARFEFQENPEHWRLVVEYEAYMDSPLYGFEAECFEDVLELNLARLRVDTPQTNQRWRLEQIALHPDWLELLHVSRGPD